MSLRNIITYVPKYRTARTFQKKKVGATSKFWASECEEAGSILRNDTYWRQRTELSRPPGAFTTVLNVQVYCIFSSTTTKISHFLTSFSDSI